MKISITTVRTFIFLFFFTLASTLVSHAATFTVDDLSDGTANASHCEADSPPAGGDCSLRDAVAAANAAADSDTINFSVTGTITLSEGEIAISEDLAITGPGADMLTVDADGNSRIFLVDDSTVAKKVVSLTGLMFINGDSYNGGAILNYEELSVDSCVFEGNSATFSGGAIYNDEDGTITEITSSTFDGNSADRRYGGAIYNFYGIINISFSTIANNSASSSTGGGIFENFGSINIRNSIVAFNGPDNCDKDIAKEAADETNNYSDDDTCGFGTGDNSTILLGDLADNGGPTETLALLGGDPVDGASADCDSINNPGVPVTNDQRYFPRPFGAACDAGAYEDGPMVSVTITKITDPPGGTDFDFTTTGFENTQESCGLKGINGQLVMDYLDSHSCVVPAGDYTVMEDIPDGQVLNIFCTDIPSGSVIDNDTGELSFSVVDDQFDVNCLFINVTPQTLLNEAAEPQGANCAEGGIKIETGLDTNLNGILDSDEVVNEYFVCDGIPGAEGPQGEEGEEGTDGLISLIALDVEPKGSNCPEGGVRVSTGLDVNRNGILDPSEVTETTYLCNGQDGEDGEDGDSDNSISCSLVSGDSSNMGTGLINFALLLLIPVICFSARKRKHQFK